MMGTLAQSTLLTLTLFGNIASAADPIPRVDAKLTTEGKIWQGQRVIITIVIKTPDTFASAPAFDLPRVSDTILIPPTGTPTLGTEAIGDDSYTTQTHELSVFPQLAGTVTIPPFAIRFDSSVGFGKPVFSRAVTTPVVSFKVRQPPGTDQNAKVLTTTKLNVTESWKPEPTKNPISVGNAFTRTIHIRADNLAAIMLPSFRTNLPEGLRQYFHDPSLNDQNNRGDLVGERTETATIVCERVGNYEIPAMSVKWWDPQAQTLRETTLPSQSINVENNAKNPQPETSRSAVVTTSHSRTPSLFLIMFLIVSLTVSYFARHAIENRWRALRTAQAASEQRYFSRITKACRSDDARATYSAILAWDDKIESALDRRANSTIPRFEGDSRLLAEFDLLESYLYGPSRESASTNWSSKRLLSCLTQFRTRWKDRHGVSATIAVLPRMNGRD